MSIESNYHRYLALTGSPEAAATLVLAAAQSAPSGVLSPPEIAKRLGCRASSVIGWIKSGQLKASNLSSSNRPRYRVQAEALADFLEKQEPRPRVRSSRPARKVSRFA